MIRGNPPHPRLELRRGPQPHPHRARSGEHDPTAPLRHRPHQGARARRRRDHAQSGQETTPRPRLPEDDREHQPAHSAWLSAPSGRLRRQSSEPEGRPVMPGSRRNQRSRSRKSPSQRTMAINPPARVRNGADNTRGSCLSSPDWRRKIRTNLPCLRALLHGHEPVEALECSANRWNLDTGAGVGRFNRLSLLEVNLPAFCSWTFDVREFR